MTYNVRDFLGNLFFPGDFVVYPTRSGSNMSMNLGRVIGFKTKAHYIKIDGRYGYYDCSLPIVRSASLTEWNKDRPITIHKQGVLDVPERAVVIDAEKFPYILYKALSQVELLWHPVSHYGSCFASKGTWVLSRNSNPDKD